MKVRTWRLPGTRWSAAIGAGLGCWVALTALPAAVAGAATVTPPPSTTAASVTGWIRFGHFVPSAGPVDVTVDGVILGTDLGFRDVTRYVSVTPGDHSVTLRSASAPATAAPIVVGHAAVVGGGAVTVAAVESTTPSPGQAAGASGGSIALQSYADNLSAPAPGQAKVRVVLTAADTSAVTTQLTASGASVSPGASPPAPLRLSQVGYGQASPYVSVAAGTYQVAVDGTDGTSLVSGTNWPVSGGTVSSIVVVEASAGPTLEVLSDAVGAASMPTGGMKTGFGGTAPRPEGPLGDLLAPLTAVLVVLVGGIVAGRLRRAHPVTR